MSLLETSSLTLGYSDPIIIEGCNRQVELNSF
jgi:hypothetical protein